MAYYVKNDAGDIMATATNRDALLYEGRDILETNKNIVTGRDGKLYIEGSEPPPPPPTPEEIKARIMEAIQNRLDAFARTRGYDNIISAASYAASTNETYHTEGQYAVQARDDTWDAAYTLLGAVLAGQRPMPTEEEVMAELPELVWPNDDPLRDVAV